MCCIAGEVADVKTEMSQGHVHGVDQGSVTAFLLAVEQKKKLLILSLISLSKKEMQAVASGPL